MTNGAEGCYFSTAAEPVVRHCPAFKVDVFDTNGCGDTSTEPLRWRLQGIFL